MPTQNHYDTSNAHRELAAFDSLIELVIDHGPDAMCGAFTQLMNTAMHIERQNAIAARSHERSDSRVAYANGHKPKMLKTTVGTLHLDIPKTRPIPGREDEYQPFYPQSLERGSRSTRAVVATLAQMYVQGVSTRDVKKVMAELGLENISSTQVSRATATLDEELNAWRNRPLGQIPYLILDARYEKVRQNGVVMKVAVLSAVGITLDGRRSVLGVSIALSEAEVHWRDFLESLLKRGMRGVTYVVSDDHAGLNAARMAVIPAAPWQRCQFHLTRNAVQHCPTKAMRSEIGEWLRSIFTAKDLVAAEQALVDTVAYFEEKAPELARWLEENVPEGLTVFSLPAEHRKRMRTSNGIERPIQQELKRRTRTVRVFPNTDAVLRLTSAILVEIDDEWTASSHAYITWPEKMPR